MFGKFFTQETLLTVLVIFFGAIVHATSKFKIARDNKLEYDRRDALIFWVLGSFSGGVFGIIASIFFTNLKVIILFSSMGSVLGMVGVNKIAGVIMGLSQILLKNLGGSLPDNEH